MFYSHEILTSPEHGVATIWLVATLGSRSITRRVNRKAILDVDVPEACRVIINPDAPMALRLQGSLLYGVSRVYHQQCGYTLLDAQSMHDKMTSMLKLMPGGGLDPSAGKTKASSLILPNDPAFLPETGLPGLDFDFSLFSVSANQDSSQIPNVWAKSPVNSVNSASQAGSVQIELPSDDGLHGVDLQHADDELNPVTSAQNQGLFGKPRTGMNDEEGVLLQPDFEFDAEGNIVEFHASKLSPRKRRKLDTSLELSEDVTMERTIEESAIPMPEDDPLARENDMMDLDIPAEEQDKEMEAPPEETVDLEQVEIARAPQHKRAARSIDLDDKTTLRNTDLARWNDEYLANMARAAKQKQQNKMQTITKKNAAFWVFGQGIGSVGVGLGVNREAHPLSFYSGEGLYWMLSSDTHRPRQKRTNESDEDSEIDENARGKRSPDGKEPPDVEIGRQGPPSLMDEHSSQMPWNISASVRSSQRGRLGSDMSVRGVPDSTGRLGSRTRGRLTSASPLAGRGYLDGRERLDSLAIPGYADGELDELERMEITRYLESELAADHEDFSTLSRRATAAARAATLDQESLNFFEFIKTSLDKEDGGHVLFSSLLPPAETTRTVATQGLMNVLTLATKGVLSVSQDPCQVAEESAGWGARYRYGEIHLTLSGA